MILKMADITMNHDTFVVLCCLIFSYGFWVVSMEVGNHIRTVQTSNLSVIIKTITRKTIFEL